MIILATTTLATHIHHKESALLALGASAGWVRVIRYLPVRVFQSGDSVVVEWILAEGSVQLNINNTPTTLPGSEGLTTPEYEVTQLPNGHYLTQFQSGMGIQVRRGQIYSKDTTKSHYLMFIFSNFLIQWERYVFTTMITSWALLDRGVDATVDDSCDNANMHCMERWLTVETVNIFCAGN